MTKIRWSGSALIVLGWWWWLVGQSQPIVVSALCVEVDFGCDNLPKIIRSGRLKCSTAPVFINPYISKENWFERNACTRGANQVAIILGIIFLLSFSLSSLLILPVGDAVRSEILHELLINKNIQKGGILKSFP